jgi:hypothetical protein
MRYITLEEIQSKCRSVILNTDLGPVTGLCRNVRASVTTTANVPGCLPLTRKIRIWNGRV